MVRLALRLTLTTVLLAGCAGPIETRVETASNADQTKYTSYTFTPEPKQPNEIYNSAKKELWNALKTKGFEEQESAILLVDFAVANRPASIAITLGEAERAAIVTKSKGQKLLQSCKDYEHRMIVTIMHRGSGAQIYRGTASEYHCNATLVETLPYLAKEALSDLGTAGDGQIRQKVLRRTGLE